jgi:hypothetical protein
MFWKYSYVVARLWTRRPRYGFPGTDKKLVPARPTRRRTLRLIRWEMMLFLLEYIGRDIKQAIHHHLVPRLGMGGVIISLRLHSYGLQSACFTFIYHYTLNSVFLHSWLSVIRNMFSENTKINVG